MKATTATAPFLSLPTGEEFLFFPDGDERAYPVDTTNESLREYSPFVLSLNAPDMNFGNQGRSYSVTPFSNPLKKTDTRYNSSTRYGQDFSFISAIPTRAPRPIRAEGDPSVVQSKGPGFISRDMIIDHARQGTYLQSLPPIVFMINPTSITREYSHIQAYQEQSKYGFIFQRWGEDLQKISVNCTIGAFLSMKNRQAGVLDGPSGLQYASKLDSASWRQLQILFMSYKNSGAIHDRLGRSRAYYGVGTHTIHYDGQEWTGRLTSFSYGNSEDKPHGGTEVSFEMTVFKHTRYDKDLKRNSLPRMNRGY